jgi:hypothetical protein
VRNETGTAEEVGYLVGGIVSLYQKAPEGRGRPVAVELFLPQSLQLTDIATYVTLVGGSGEALFHAIANALAIIRGFRKALIHSVL